MDAYQLIEHLYQGGFSISTPVDIEKIAELMNIKIIEQSELPCNGAVAFLMVNDSQPVILLAETESEKRKRFILAHMMGHLFLHVRRTNAVFVDTAENITPRAYWDIKELQANNFAMDLLVPRQLMQKEIPAIVRDVYSEHKRKPSNDELAKLVASRFQVPLDVAEHKLIIAGIINPSSDKLKNHCKL